MHIYTTCTFSTILENFQNECLGQPPLISKMLCATYRAHSKRSPRWYLSQGSPENASAMLLYCLLISRGVFFCTAAICFSLPTMAVLSFCRRRATFYVFSACLLYFQCAWAITGSVYQLDSEYSGANFFQGFDFYTVSLQTTEVNSARTDTCRAAILLEDL